LCLHVAETEIRHVGAFLVGIIVPREGGLAIALTEKLEDMVSIVFLPLVRVVIVLHYNLTYLVVSTSRFLA